MSNVYEQVTDEIVRLVEEGIRNGSGECPWHRSSLVPINATSRKAYRGINTLVLWGTAHMRGYAGGEWATYRQWAAKGAQVRKAEHGSGIVFWKVDEHEDPADGTTRRSALARGYTVFNAAQVDGYEPEAVVVLPEAERIAQADAVARAALIEIRTGGEACYSPVYDRITMPAFGAFKDADAYYAVLFHELTHATGHEGRLRRNLLNRFGSEAYAMEELVAELGAAFVCASLGIAAGRRPDHADYVASWLRRLRGDKRAIFTAAASAQAAADWLRERAGLLTRIPIEDEEKAA